MRNIRDASDAAAGEAPGMVAEVDEALSSLNRSLVHLEATLESLRDASARGPEAMDRAIDSVEEVQRAVVGIQELPLIRKGVTPKTTAPVAPERPVLTPPADQGRAPAKQAPKPTKTGRSEDRE
jgi:hypothetical protein